jgi:hypothetical protein
VGDPGGQSTADAGLSGGVQRMRAEYKERVWSVVRESGESERDGQTLRVKLLKIVELV